MLTQLLDTVWEVYLHYHQIPSLDQLAIPATLVKDIPYINGFLSSSPPALLGQELTALYPLRPRSISALPALARKLPTLQGLPSGLLDHQHTYNLVDNLEHAKALEAELWAQNNKKGTAKGSDAHNFPEDKASQQRLKNELFFAIINCNTIIEKPGNPQVKKIQGLTNLELEIMAWKVLVSSVTRSECVSTYLEASLTTNLFPRKRSRTPKMASSGFPGPQPHMKLFQRLRIGLTP